MGWGTAPPCPSTGCFKGWPMPMLYFPSSLLSSFASLLIPKIAKEREQDHRRAVAHITGKAVRLALAFGMFFSGVFLLFGDSWGMAFYHSGDAGAYLRVLAPLAPLVYLDVVVDSLLKGLDEQFNSHEVQLRGFLPAGGAGAVLAAGFSAWKAMCASCFSAPSSTRR